MAIRNHLGEEASDLFSHIGHSDDAYAIVNANQVAWARPTSEVNRLAKKYALMVNVLERSMLSKQKVRG